MFEDIMLNVLTSKKISQLNINCVEITRKPDDLIDNRLFMKDLIKILKKDFLGYFHSNKIYFFENYIKVKEILKTRSISINDNSYKRIKIDFKNQLHKNILKKILYDQLEKKLKEKNFITPLNRNNLALPNPIIQKNVDYPIFHYDKYIESFLYNFIVNNNKAKLPNFELFLTILRLRILVFLFY